MSPLRWTQMAVCLVLPAVAWRLGGVGLWAAFAVGFSVAAALAAWDLHRDGVLGDALRPRSGDTAYGFGTAAALYVVIFLLFRNVIAPGNFLPLCGPDGALFGQPGVHGFTAATEWVRDQACGAFGHFAGLRGVSRGVLVVFVSAVEEIAWRGGVQQSLSDRLGTTRGWLAASVLYALANGATGNAMAALLALVAGLLFGGLFRVRGRLAPGVFAHCTFMWFFLYSQPVLRMAHG